MKWAERKKIIYFLITALVLGLGLFVVVRPYISREPNCFDNRQNGDERGIDCGGSCTRVCVEDARPLVVLWARAFPVSDVTHNAVAYIENRNSGAAAESVWYEFKLYDSNNVLVTERRGSTFISPRGRTAIIEPALFTGDREPARTVFSFITEPVWQMVSQDLIDSVMIEAKDISIERTEGSPRVSAKISNKSLFDLRDIEFVAILFDADQNAVASSKTVLSLLESEDEKTIFFTWPEPFSEEIRRVEIIPRVNILLIK